MDSHKIWNIEAAKKHYRVKYWALQHFDINTKGNVEAKIGSAAIDLYQLSKNLKNQGAGFPVLVRFPQILQQSLNELSSAFQQAIETSEYSGKYIAAYPIKVNQQASVIQHFQQQNQWPIAFEVGSKAELIACLGIVDQRQTIICNGYKDEAYIRLALMGSLLGHKVVIVIESLAEFEFVLKQSTELDVQPDLGMRVRLNSIAKGNWQNTGGEYSKFGLTSNEVLSLVERLKSTDTLASMKMLHFHMGSQISCLQDMQLGVQEGMHYFSQLAEYGIEFEHLNIGGGLAVDYEGSQSDKYFSMDYSISDYAKAVVKIVQMVCEKYSITAPTIFSENGRAMTAHHAVLITNVLDAEIHQASEQDECLLLSSNEVNNASLSMLIEHVKTIVKMCSNDGEKQAVTEVIRDLKSLSEKLENEFSTANLSLSEKSIAERLLSYAYWKVLTSKIDIEEQDQAFLQEKFIAKYFCNFSLFQSVPDIWGLKQIFPILPLHRNNEPPVIKSRIYDLTCDSDGRIDRYVEADSVQSHLSLHEFQQQKDYILGIFLVGAYQEILGDMHNLFGNTHTVNIVINEDGSYQKCDEEPGDTITEILSYLHIDTVRMRQVWEEKLVSNHVSGHKKVQVIDELTASLYANNYLS